MSTKFKTVITTAGAAKLAAATVSGGKKVNITTMAVGDGGGKLPVPNAGQTRLINEVWRHAPNKVSQDSRNSNYIIAELVVPPEVGGFWMRELGLYDDTGTLIAVSNMAESYKPALAEGSGRAQTCRMVIIVSSVASVELTIDTTTVMATQSYVDDKIAEHEQSRRHPDASLTAKGFTQLSSATDSASETLAATPKAVKAAYDLANRKYTAQDATTTQKGIVQLSSATDSASETLAATPKAVKAAYDLANRKYTAQDASTTQKGIVQLSSTTNNESETLAATPKAVKIAMDNASARLAKDRNGADIPNKPLFIQNLGLQETVNQASGALQKNQNGADIPGKDTFTKNIGAAKAASGSISIGGDSNNWTTAQFIGWLEAQGAFNHPYWMCKGSWSYASNKIITDTGCGNIQLAGSVVEVMGTRSAMTIRVTTPTTATNGATTKAQFTYINHGDTYAPGWHRDWNRSGDTMTGELTTTSQNALRMIAGNYGAILRQDGGSLYLLFTASGDQYGSWNGLRPFYIALNTGLVTMGHGLNVHGQVIPSNYSNFDSRYVGDVRLGTRVVQLMSRGGRYEIAGHALTGLRIIGEVDGDDEAIFRPIQKYINGTWYNVAQV